MQETPDRWHRRLVTTARSHGRIAVVSSCLIAGTVLVSGVVLLTQNTSSNSARDAATRSDISTSTSFPFAGVGDAKPTTTTSTVPGASTPSSIGIEPQGSVTTNPGPGTPSAPGSTPSVETTVPPVTAPNATAAPPPALPQNVAGTAAPRRATNGQLLPTIAADVTASTEDPKLNLKMTAGDRDGYITRISINWNDDSPWTVVDFPLASCIEPLNSLVNPSASHTYTTAGSYMVSVTVTSVNCSGDGMQQSIITKPVSVGGSRPVTTTSPPA